MSIIAHGTGCPYRLDALANHGVYHINPFADGACIGYTLEKSILLQSGDRQCGSGKMVDTTWIFVSADKRPLIDAKDLKKNSIDTQRRAVCVPPNDFLTRDLELLRKVMRKYQYFLLQE